MKRTFVVFCVLLLPSFFVRSQDKVNDAVFRRWYQEAENLYNAENPSAESDKEAIELYLKTAAFLRQHNIEPAMQVDCLKKTADIYLGSSLYPEAVRYYNGTIEANRQTGLKDSTYDYQAKLYLGAAYYQSNIIDSARYYFEIAAAYANQHPSLPDLSFLYNSLGILYYESGNFLQAKNYFEQAYPQQDSLQYKDPDTYVSLSNNIATCLKLLGKKKEALELYHKLLPLNIAVEKIYYNIAHTHFLSGQYDSALLYYDKVNVQDDITVIRKLNDIGRILTEKGAWVKAEQIFDSAIVLNKQTVSPARNKELAYSYFYKAFLAEEQGLLDEAIGWCNNSLQVLHFNFKWKNPADLPEDETRVISPIVFFEVLQKKAALLTAKHQKDNNRFTYERSLATYMMAIKVASFIKSSFDNDDAGYFFKENYREIYSDAIEVAYKQIQGGNSAAPDNFLQIMESYKGSILYHNLKKLELKNSATVPPGVINKEKGLKQSLAAYTTLLNNDFDKTKVASIQKRITELKVEISRLQKLYEQYPEFEIYKRQSDATGITVDSISDKLDGATCVISFLYTPVYIYGLAITDKEFIAHRITVDSSLKGAIDGFLQSLYSHTGGKRYEGYTAAAYIYRQLITPFLPAASAKKRWVILPDGILNFMPFNALQESAGSRNYLAENKIISNHYSLLLLLNNNRTIEHDIKTPVIFAPFIEKNDSPETSGLPALFSSAAEVKAFKGDSFTAEKATKSIFLNTARQASIIHLATHAAADIDSANNACIYFYPSDSNLANTRLYAPEVYNLELPHTRLVILSACETARGKNSSGEGLLSLARAFLYAGSDGAISTFWKTEDKISAYIMQQVHHHLRQSKTPEEALYLAKKDFLNNDGFDAHYKTPNYWANFIYIGSLTPMDPPLNEWYFIIPVCLLLVLVFYYAMWKKAST